MEKCRLCGKEILSDWDWCPYCALPTARHPSPEWAVKMLVIDKTVQKVIGTHIDPKDDVPMIVRKVVENVETGLLDITSAR